jgi:hypothetical protein
MPCKAMAHSTKLLPWHLRHQSHRIQLIRWNCMFVEWNSTSCHTQMSSPQACYGMLLTLSGFQMPNIDSQNGDIYWGNPVTGTLIGTWHNGTRQCSWASPGRTSDIVLAMKEASVLGDLANSVCHRCHRIWLNIILCFTVYGFLMS